ncbi:MAG: tetratricopeptide repeat protein [Ferruginibacter sp.]
MWNIIILLILLFQLPITGQSQTVIQMKSEGGVSIIPCKVNGLYLNFIFDTGASDVSISLTEATFMLKNGYLENDDILGTSKYFDANGNLNKGVVINLRKIDIGGLILDNVKASIVTNLKAPLLLGQSAINKLGKMQLDLQSNTLIIYNSSSKNKANEKNTDTTISRTSISSKYADFMISGANNMIKNNHVDAIKDFTNAIELNPNNPDAFLLRGAENFSIDNYESALNDYTRAIELNSVNPLAFYSRSLLFTATKKYAEAVKDLNKAIQLKNNDPNYFYYRGYNKEYLDDDFGAIQEYNKAIELNPEYAEAYSSRGLSKANLKDNIGALQDYNKAIELNPKNHETFYFRGKAKANRNDYKGAIQDYNNAIELNPIYKQAYYARGISYLLLRQKEKGCADLSKAGELGERKAYDLIREHCN